MELQKVFKKSYMEYLRTHIDVQNYRAETFPYDKSMVRSLANVYKPEGLLEKLNPEDDFKTAVEIYKAYEKISPLLASLPDLWVYLTHVDLFPYVQKRWREIFKEKFEENYIVNHWHKHSTHFLRTTFAGFWWNAYLTVDDNREDRFELTKVMYDCGQDWRLMRFGELSLIRRKEAVIGVLEFLKENPEITCAHFTARGQFISRYFNNLGGVINLSSMGRNYFKETLMDIKERILQIQSEDDVHYKGIDL